MGDGELIDDGDTEPCLDQRADRVAFDTVTAECCTATETAKIADELRASFAESRCRPSVRAFSSGFGGVQSSM